VYSPNEAIESTTLLQGDVVSKVQILGALKLRGIYHHRSAVAGGEATAWTVAAPPRIADAMVLSHSCEISRDNAVKVTSLILAPLRDVNRATSPDKVQELIQSNLIDQAGARASYLKYFYLPPNPSLEHSDGAVVDFSKLFSLRKDAYDFLLGKKVAELAEDTRRSMALKLALYFSRNDS